MAVTKQVYTVTAAPTWTNLAAATAFESAFVDAGLMTSWYDSFANGAHENRVLEVIYDPTKTYGKTYYWFIFVSNVIYVHIATGWNSTTHVPTGTQYLDYFSTATNTAGNHRALYTPGNNTADLYLTRYTASGSSWFTIHLASTYKTFGIIPSTHTVRSWIDLDKVCFSGLIESKLVAQTTAASVTWETPPVFTAVSLR